jgi:hypothetical protein
MYPPLFHLEFGHGTSSTNFQQLAEAPFPLISEMHHEPGCYSKHHNTPVALSDE